MMLEGKLALVAGATRGAGRGTRSSSGAAAATVYVTGRTTREQPSEYARRETIEETAELVSAAGGVGIAVQVDHLVPDEVERLVGRIRAEQGRLDVLVDDVWGGERLIEWHKPVWEHDLQNGLGMLALGARRLLWPQFHRPRWRRADSSDRLCDPWGEWPRRTVGRHVQETSCTPLRFAAPVTDCMT